MKVFLNEDWLHYFWTRENEEITEKQLKEFIYQYKNTTVTDFLFNVNGTVSSSPSKIFETWVDKYLAKEENGTSVDYVHTLAMRAYDIFVRKNLDAYAIWIECCKEIGINPWLSFRMNDVHRNMERTHLLKSSIVEKFSSSWISSHRKTEWYFDKCLDYTKKEVRERMLSYIAEQVERYDVFGVELDFTREPFCFPCGKEEEGQKIIFDFVKSVRTILYKVGTKRGKRIALSILGQSNPISALKTGFDISDIARAGLIDLFVASPRWETVNTDIPVELWKKLLPENTLFGCSQGLLLRSAKSESPMMCDVPTDMGQAVANIHRGCDIIYLYNHFDRREDGLEVFSHENDIRNAPNIRYIYENIGKVIDYEKWERRIPITYDDFVAFSESVSTRLPISSSFATFRIPCGKIDAERTIYINIVLKERVLHKNLTVYVNTQKAQFYGNSTKIIWANGNVYTYAIKLKTDKILGVELESDTPVTVCYLDAFITPVK